MGANVKDIYAEVDPRRGKSSHLWPGPEQSVPITLEMFGDVLPPEWEKAREEEKRTKRYSVKPGSVLFDRMLWSTNAAGVEYDAFGDVGNADLVLVMGTSLSGLTIDNLAHMAGRLGTPRIVFDMTTAPVESIQENGRWTERDSFLQGPLDRTLLEVLREVGWIDQLYDFLPDLCLGSLNNLKSFAEERALLVPKLDEAIAAEVDREKGFYGG